MVIKRIQRRARTELPRASQAAADASKQAGRFARRSADRAREAEAETARLFQPSAAERRIQTLQFVGEPREIKRGSVFIVRGTDGQRYVYKPLSRKFHRPKSALIRELAAYRVDRLFGFGLVPPTAIVHGPFGMGSAQLWVPSRNGGDPRIDTYPGKQEQQMAVLDYVIANADRSALNYRRRLRSGGLLACDHERCLPNERDTAPTIASSFTHMHLGIRLDDRVLAPVDAVHPGQLRAALSDIDVSKSAIKGAGSRMAEIQKHGRIIGKAFPGPILPELPLWI